MANKNGIITRRDIIEDEALKWGDVYEESLKKSIEANNVLVQSVKELNKQIGMFKNVQTQVDFIALKKQSALETTKATDAIKIEIAEDQKRQKIIREGIATAEAQRKANLAQQKAQQAGIKLTLDERVQLAYNNKLLKQEAIERLGLASAYTKLNNERAKAKNILRDLIASETASSTEIKKAQKEFERLDEKVRKADRAVGDFTKNVGNYKLGSIVSNLKDLAGAFGIVGGAAAVASALKGAYNTIKQFEQGVADLSAITGASGKDLEYLRSQAIDLGKSTKGGAVAVVEAYKLIGSAKPELLSNVDALNQVTEATLTLSQAAGIEMPDAATALTGAMNQFGADASQVSTFIDALANGAKYGAVEIPQTTEALLKFGAVAKNAGVSIQESVAAIQILGPSFKSSEEAGTGFRNLMLKITAPDALPKKAFEELSGALKESGSSIEFLKDKSVPFAEKLAVLSPLLKDNSKLVEVFGVENVTAATALLKQKDAFEELIPKIYESGTAQQQAAIRMDTLQGKTELMTSTYDSFVLSVGSGDGVISKSFKFIIESATTLLNDLIRINTSWDDLYAKASQDGAKEGLDNYNRRLADAKQNNIGVKGKRFVVDEDQASLSIAKAAAQNRERIKVEQSQNEKAIKEYSTFKSGVLMKEGIYFLNKKKENLAKEYAQENAIIVAHNKRIEEQRRKTTPTDPAKTTGTPANPAKPNGDAKARQAQQKKEDQDEIDRLKKQATAEYELKKQRLEQNAQINDQITSDNQQADDVRIQAMYNSQQTQEDLLLLAKNYELEKVGTNTTEKLKIEEKYAFDVIELDKKVQKERDNLTKFDPTEYDALLKQKSTQVEIAMNSDLATENDRHAQALQLANQTNDQIQAEAKKHEDEMYRIKLDAAKKLAQIVIDNTTIELANFEKQSDGSAASTQFILDLKKRIAEAQNTLSEKGLEQHTKTETETVKKSKLSATEILQSSIDMTGALADLANAFSQAKIKKIDEELDANEKHYAKQIERAGNDKAKKEALEKERDKKTAELEKKKRAEQNKQAKIDKAVTIAQIVLKTALAVMNTAATAGPFAVPITIALGAIQMATAIATPIPKYKMGRQGGPQELAIVGDGGRSELIERANGQLQLTPSTDTLVQLQQGDKVHSSIEAYYALQRATLLASIDLQGKRATNYQAQIVFDSHNKELLAELRENTRAIKNQKNTTIVNVPKIDMAHELWKMKNRNWG